MRALHWFQISLVVMLLCLAYVDADTYIKDYPVVVTVIGKMNVEHTYKSNLIRRPVVGVRSDSGDLFDVELSVAQYSQWNVGDRFRLMRSDAELHPNGWRELLSFLSGLGLIIGVIATIVTLVATIYEWRNGYGED